MDFPSYVPHAVRVSMAARLDGDAWNPTGWVSVLAAAEAEVQRLDALQSQYADDAYVLDNIRPERLGAGRHLDHMADEVACLQRLVHDARMQPAYVRLVGALNSDEHLSGFIYAAWAARVDYDRHRQEMKGAADLASKVAKAAGALSALLREAEETGGHGHFPSGFFSVAHLLKETNHGEEHRDYDMWPSMRRQILGEAPPRAPDTQAVAGELENVNIRFVSLRDTAPVEPAEAERGMLRYAWGTAPGIAGILATLQREAAACSPTNSGFIGAALASQKRNRKTEYLRAFGALLREQHRIELSAEIMGAMATTATVVLNDPDLDATYDDVRKALATIGA